MTDIDAQYRDIFENNRAWVRARRDADEHFFERLAREQHPDFLYIGCSDSRVPANEIMGLEPGEVCMCAAHNEDLAAARSCGLRTAFFARPTEHGPAQTTDLRAEQDWDVIADDLIDLARRLGA